MASSTSPSFEDVARSLDSLHEQYVSTLRLLHEVAARSGGSNTSRPPLVATSPGAGWSNTNAPLPVSRAVTFHSDPSLGQPSGSRVRRPTNELPDPRRLSGHGPEKRPQSPPSNHDGDSDSDKGHGGDAFLPLTAARTFTFSEKVPDPPMTYVKEPLRSETFSEQQLAVYLRSLDEENVSKGTIKALDDVWLKRAEINEDNVLKNFEPANNDSPYLHATYEVYEIGKKGLAQPMNTRHGDEDGEVLDTSTVWDTISKVNKEGDAVGRMTILQEPSPLTLGAAHMTMREHFDMDELFQHLVTKDINKGKTRAYMDRAFEETPLRQRTFFFVFKYYTILGTDLIPAPWQAYDRRPLDRRSDDHIDIVECSSVLALSLQDSSHTPITQRVKKRGKIVAQKGRVYDTFAPWHLLNMQSFPDQLHSVREDEDLTDPFYNGPYAFLDCLGMEYRDAVKRYTQLYESITKLITPPDQFMFDAKLRDKLLFEDAHFTYSRRYFWAYNTLGVINDGIKSMCKSYTDTFTPDFWRGRHRTLWPHPDPDSAEGIEYAARMGALKQELDSAVAVLIEVQAKNERTRKEIGSLREQLFSGSSVKESRRAIEQGDNIKVLTGISMIFLPLTFVTGVFSITTVDIETWDWRFYTTMVAVCVPFFFLIFVLQTRVGMAGLKKYWQLLKRHQVRPLMALLGLGGTTNRAGGAGTGSGGTGGGGADASGGGGGGADGRRGKMRRRNLKPGIRRTQPGLATSGHHHHHINRRGTGNSTSMGGRKGVVSSSWARMRVKLPAWGGVASQKRKEREWEWWWQKRRRAEEGVGAGDEKVSNV
ncbi:hypothetical protein QBC37DRAFT_198740 [Rhypophila decipiens]|uniref:Uncharacterized protein n=1 Tax=Rhypophila decipiens TaxID=261697 RepID=A0AAN7BC46_9PEZI|nr:hypothetical protein QBC37DRAFT_198740 [Rhypophila decipiens]